MTTKDPSDIIESVSDAYRAFAEGKGITDPRKLEQLARIHKACCKGAGWNHRKGSGKPRGHPERDEMLVLAEWLNLRLKEHEWFHAPSEGSRSPMFGASLKAQGFSAGFPDVIIFKPPLLDGLHGAALELKKPGATYSSVTPEQRAWLASLDNWGWATSWHAGADSAIKWLEHFGY